MRKIISICSSILLLCIACEKDLPRFETEQDRLNFILEDERNGTIPSTIRKTFVYDPEDMVRDTVYVPVNSMGFVRDYDRYFKVEQILENADSVFNAEPGVHYISFDDPEVSRMMYIPAGEMEAYVPIIALRAPSMKDTVTVLHLRIIASDDFLPGDPDRIDQTVEIGDQLMQPKNWVLLGAYGYEKHRFLIEHFNMNFDEDTFELFIADIQYGRYINSKAKNLLAEENAERAARGEGPLTERDGTIVSFP